VCKSVCRSSRVRNNAGLHAAHVTIIVVRDVVVNSFSLVMNHVDLVVKVLCQTFFVLEHLVNKTLILRSLLNELSKLGVRLT